MNTSKVTFTLKNVGLIKETSLSLNDMTIICGKNNTGKTYITYSIYGFLSMWDSLIEFNISRDIRHEIRENGIARINLKDYTSARLHQILKRLSSRYTQELSDIFSVEEDFFEHSEFTVQVDELLHNADISPLNKEFSLSISENITIQKQADSHELIVSVLDERKRHIAHFYVIKRLDSILGKLFFGDYFPDPFIITSERTGISLFYKELDIHRNVLIEQIAKQKKEFRPFELFDKVVSRYAMPIQHNINYTRDISDIIKRRKSFLYNDLRIKKYFTSLLNGRYKIEDDGMYLIPQRSKTKMPIHFSSSATKSLLQLYFYIRHSVREGEILIIDEPELNLHQDNQLIIARLLNYLMQQGILVFITTHSDYIIKEYTNLIRLKKPLENKESLIKKYKYHKGEYADHTRIHAYQNNDGDLKACEVDEIGIEVLAFDEVIDKLNSAMNDIYFGIDDEDDDHK